MKPLVKLAVRVLVDRMYVKIGRRLERAVIDQLT